MRRVVGSTFGAPIIDNNIIWGKLYGQDEREHFTDTVSLPSRTYNVTLGCSFTQSIPGNYSTFILPQNMHNEYMGMAGSNNDMLFRSYHENKKIFLNSKVVLIQMTTPYRSESWNKDMKEVEVFYDQLPKFLLESKEYIEVNPIQVWMKSIWLYQFMVDELLRNSVEVIFLPYMFRYEQSTHPFLFENNFKLTIDDVKEMFPTDESLLISDHNPWHYYEIGGEEESWTRAEQTKQRWWRMGKNYYQRHDHLNETHHKLCGEAILKDKDS